MIASESRLAAPKELDEETNWTQRLDVMQHLGLDDTRGIRRQNVLFRILALDSIAKPALQDTDARPDSRLG